MNKIVILTTTGIAILIIATLFIIVADRETNTQNIAEETQNNNEESSQEQVNTPTPSNQIEIAGTITSVSFEENATILEIEEFDGETRMLRVDSTTSITYYESENRTETEEAVQVPTLSYNEIEEGQKISATILQKGDDISSIEYRGPVLIYE